MRVSSYVGLRKDARDRNEEDTKKYLKNTHTHAHHTHKHIYIYRKKKKRGKSKAEKKVSVKRTSRNFPR